MIKSGIIFLNNYSIKCNKNVLEDLDPTLICRVETRMIDIKFTGHRCTSITEE